MSDSSGVDDDKPSKDIVPARGLDRGKRDDRLTGPWELAKEIRGGVPVPLDAPPPKVLFYSTILTASLSLLYAVAATESTGRPELGLLLAVIMLLAFPVLVAPHVTRTIKSSQRRLDRNGYLSDGKRAKVVRIYQSLPVHSEGRRMIQELDRIALAIVASDYWDSDEAAHLRADLDPFDVVYEAAVKANRGDTEGIDQSIKVLRRVLDLAIRMDSKTEGLPELEAPNKTDLESAETYLDALEEIDQEDQR